MRAVHVATVLAASALGLVIAGCFSPNYGNGDLQCGPSPGYQCPKGYQCQMEATPPVCVPNGTPDGGPTTPDASTIDASPIDVVHSTLSLIGLGAGGGSTGTTTLSTPRATVLVGPIAGTSTSATTSMTVKWGPVPSAQVP